MVLIRLKNIMGGNTNLYLQKAVIKTKNISEINKKELRKIRIISIYAFLSGFVFFEPSFAEIFFILTVPLLLFSIKFDYKATIFTTILFISVTTSFLRGNSIGWFNLNYSIRYTVIDFYLILLFLVFISVIKQIKNKNSLIDLLMRWWTLSAFINIFTCFFAIVTGVANLGGVSVVSFGIRFQGFFKDPNVLGPFLTLPAAFWFEKYLKNKKRNILYLAISIILMVGVVMTFSRAAWLNIFFTVFGLILMHINKINLRNYLRIFSFVLLVLLLLIFLIETNIEIFGYQLSNFFRSRLRLQSYDQDRFEAQRSFTKGIEIAPFLGVGPGNYSLLSEGFATHNLYFRNIGEKGLFGLLTLLILLFVVLKNFWRIRKSYAFLFCGFVGTLINSFFIDSWHWRHIWVLFVLGFVFNSKTLNKRSDLPAISEE